MRRSPPEVVVRITISRNAERGYFSFLLKQIERTSKNEAKICCSNNPTLFVSRMNNQHQVGTDHPQAVLWEGDSESKPEQHALVVLDSSSWGAMSSTEKNSNWEIEMVVGPFLNPKGARDFSVNWRTNSRGILSRRHRGLVIFKAYLESHPGTTVNCFDKRLVPVKPDVNKLLIILGLSEFVIEERTLSCFYKTILSYPMDRV